MRLMKYYIIIVVAGLSFLLAIPLTKTPTSPITHIKQSHLEAKQAVIKALPLSITTVQPVAPAVVTPKIEIPVAKPIITTASYRCAAYEGYFKQYDWNTNTAMAICQAESSGIASEVSDPNSNYDHIPDYGLMQLHGIAILDPADNISYAYHHKYLTQGWGAWSTYNSGKYQQFL